MTNSSAACEVCAQPFGLFLWRHECKVCNRAVCGKCSAKQQLDQNQPTRRVCVQCSGRSTPPQTPSTQAPVSPRPGAAAAVTAEAAATAEGEVRREADRRGGFDPWRAFSRVEVEIVEARGLLKMDVNVMGTKTSSDPYVVTEVADEGISERTPTVKNNVNPVFNDQFVFELLYPSSKLVFRLYDADVAGRDDLLGVAEVSLAECERNRSYEGWLVLKHAEHPGKAGMLHVVIRVTSSPFSEMYGHFRKQWSLTYPEQPPPTPPFEVDALYSPAMLLLELVGNRLLFPIAESAANVVLWTSLVKSTLAVALWPLLSRYVSFWPSAGCFLLAVVMYMKPRSSGLPAGSSLGSFEPIKRPVITRAASSDTTPETQSMGGFVNFVAKAAPGSLKDTARNFQLPLQAVSQGVVQVHDIFHWRSPLSETCFRGLIAAGVILLFLPFWVLVMTTGLVVLLAFSPLAVSLKAVWGYAERARVQQPTMKALQPSFDPAFAAM